MLTFLNPFHFHHLLTFPPATFHWRKEFWRGSSGRRRKVQKWPARDGNRNVVGMGRGEEWKLCKMGKASGKLGGGQERRQCTLKFFCGDE
jgi:hypothetical protein